MSSSNVFQKAEDEYFRLKGQVATRRITQEQFEAALKALMVQDAQGRYWMLGPDTGKWYVYDGAAWVEANPADTEKTVMASPSTVTAAPASPKPRGSGKYVLLAVGCVVMLCLIAVAGLALLTSQGIVRLSFVATATPTLTPTPIPPLPTSTPLPSSTPLPTTTPLPSSTPLPTSTPLLTSTPWVTSTPLPTLTARPTVTPTRLTAPIFGTVVCSSVFDEVASVPINPSPNKVVAAGTNRVYASWSYQVPGPVTYKYTWYLDGNVVFSDQLKVTETTGTMWVGTWYTDNRRLQTGSWKFEVRTLDDKLLITDVCTIR